MQHAGFLVAACGLLVVACMRDLVPPTRDQTQAPCIGSSESYPLDYKGSPKIPGHSKLDSWKLYHLAGISTRNAALKGTKSNQTSVMVQRDIFPNDKLEKLAREAQQLAPEKKKHG